jgi:DNA-binding MarR family transcriptional regulator
MSPSARDPHRAVRLSGGDASRPLSALLSQVLVAFTVELDNEFELRMARLGFPGGRLSLAAWLDLLRFIGADPVSVKDLEVHSLLEQSQIKAMLACLERWGFVWLGLPRATDFAAPAAQSRARAGLREGFGSGRGINTSSTAQLTPMGLKAREVWQPLPKEVEERWRKRFGDETAGTLRQSLETLQEKSPLELPQGLVDVRWRRRPFPAKTSSPAKEGPAAELPLPALLAQPLVAFAIEFEPKSEAPLALCANTIRVLSRVPTPEAALPRLTGCSPENCGLGWQLKPFVVVEPDPGAKRGKALRLSARGLEAQARYSELTTEIEASWAERFGREQVARLSSALLKLFDLEGNGPHPLLISEGLVPPPGVLRAGDSAPALGPRSIGSAALNRMRDLVAQTEAFIADPVHALPHYPMLDMNRGFGP